MNYLAHLFLSGQHPLLRLGNLMGDFMKGADLQSFHPDLRQGVTLHRLIDAYTDTHAIVRQSKARIAAPYGRFAGVLIDVFYDHCLATEWHQYSEMPLNVYLQVIYRDLQQYQSLLSPRLQQIVPRIVTENWLSAYQSMDGIALTIRRLAQRIRKPSLLEHGIEAIEPHYELLRGDFRTFFPDLIHYAQVSKNHLEG